MKKSGLAAVIFAIIAAILITGCKSTASVSFSEVPDKEWKLNEVYINGRNTGFDRNELIRAGSGEIFTLKFNSEMISGTGAPNRYNAPYSVGDNRTIKIELVRATLMAPIGYLSNLRENEYFSYVQNTYKWNIVNEKLELLSKLDNGNEIRLVFSL